MRARTLAVTAVTSALAVASLSPAAYAKKPAAPKPLVFKDATGDGNGLNDQGFGVGPASTPTPVQVDGFDIVSVKLVTDKAGSAATKLLATLELKAAPQSGGLYRILGDIGGSCFWTELALSPQGVADGSAVRVCDDSTTGYTYYDVSSKVDGNKITWTIPIKSFKSAGLKPGAAIGGLGADARGSEVAVTVPSMDRASSDLMYKVGQ